MSDYKNGDTASWDSAQVRRSQAGQSGGGRRPPQQRRRRRINPILYILCVLVVSASLAGVGWLLASDLFAFSREIPSTQDITIEVTAEDDMGSIADKLQNAGLIKYKSFFRLFAAVTGPITSADMQTDSPYNLYQHAGLPPTPISNPGLASIDAALNPNSTNYYYYALGTDGKHHFSTTLAEHNAFVNSSSYGG